MSNRHAPSLLLRNINASVNALTQIYATHCKQSTSALLQQSQHKQRQMQKQHVTPALPSSSLTKTFPQQPASDADGDQVLRFFCSELDMNYNALVQWRRRITQKITDGWGVARLRSTSYSTAVTQSVAKNIMKTKATGSLSSSVNAINNKQRPQVQHSWFIPRAQDVKLVRSACEQLKAVISPFITLSPSPCLINAQSEMSQQLRRAMQLQRLQNSLDKNEGKCRNINENNNSKTSWDDVDDDGQYTPPSIRPTTFQQCSTFYATRFIPAGMFLLSLPTQAAIFASLQNAPSAAKFLPQLRTSSASTSTSYSSSYLSKIPTASSDFALQYFMQIEQLIAQLVTASQDESLSHCTYARYLMQNVVPCKNLPFLSQSQMAQLLQLSASYAPGSDNDSNANPKNNKQSHNVISVNKDTRELHQSQNTLQSLIDTNAQDVRLNSPAWLLWHFFHKQMHREPLSVYLQKKLTQQQYAWWISLILSRRSGSSMLIPLMDKLNHSPLPNCYYTMSSEQTLCGLDIFDNMLAGVRGQLLYEPYIHLFSIRDIDPGQPLTLCYCSAQNNLYKAADSRSVRDVVAHYKQYMSNSDKQNTNNYYENVRINSTTTSLTSSQQDQQQNNTSMANKRMFKQKLHALQSTVQTLFGKQIVSQLNNEWQSNTHKTTHNDSFTSKAHQLSRWKHHGRQEVDTVEGKASWMLQWGFVPQCDSVYSHSDLRQVAALVAQRRLDTRQALFPHQHTPSFLC